MADLDGLARPDGGYYQKGSGLPRIDVIGRTVAWRGPDLVERLQQIQVEGATDQNDRDGTRHVEQDYRTSTDECGFDGLRQ